MLCRTYVRLSVERGPADLKVLRYAEGILRAAGESNAAWQGCTHCWCMHACLPACLPACLSATIMMREPFFDILGQTGLLTTQDALCKLLVRGQWRHTNLN